MGVRFFEDGNALDSLRASDFDALSAYGEVIDNAIQAKATEINLKFEAPISGKKTADRCACFCRQWLWYGRRYPSFMFETRLVEPVQ